MASGGVIRISRIINFAGDICVRLLDHLRASIADGADGQTATQSIKFGPPVLKIFSSSKLSCGKTPTFTVLSEYHNFPKLNTINWTISRNLTKL